MAWYTTKTLAKGTHTITAIYGGSTNFDSSFGLTDTDGELGRELTITAALASGCRFRLVLLSLGWGPCKQKFIKEVRRRAQRFGSE